MLEDILLIAFATSLLFWVYYIGTFVVGKITDSKNEYELLEISNKALMSSAAMSVIAIAMRIANII